MTVWRDTGNIKIKVRAIDDNYITAVHFYVDSVNNNLMRAKIVCEALEDVLKPRSKEEINAKVLNIIKSKDNIDLSTLKLLPANINFDNDGMVDLWGLETLPEGTQFNNKGNVYLENLEIGINCWLMRELM